MSERDISRRMEAIRAGQANQRAQAAQKDAEARRRQQADAERVREVRSLASSFTIWAAKNKIPTETKPIPKGRKFKNQPVWKFAEVPFSYDGEDGGSVRSSTVFIVDRKASIYIDRRSSAVALPRDDLSLTSEVAVTALRQPTPTRDDILLRPEHIHQRIAELCVEHGLEAPDL